MLDERTPLQYEVDNHIVCSSTICLIKMDLSRTICAELITQLFILWRNFEILLIKRVKTDLLEWLSLYSDIPAYDIIFYILNELYEK